MTIIEPPPAGPSSPSSARPRRRPPEVLTEPEAIALIRACSTRAPTGVRNRALIAVLWRSGLRISEALALELRDVDLQAGSLRVRHGKGDKSRTVGVDEQTAAMLARWIDRRRKLSPGARAPIFCTLAGSRMDASYVRHLLPRLAAKAGLDRRVHAHGLRHTYAYYTKPIPAERAVHNMEHGAVWITYVPNLSASEVKQLVSFVGRQSLLDESQATSTPGQSNRYIDLSPWPTDSLPSPIVLSAWGHQLQVTSATDPRMQQFVDTFRNSAKYTPEYGAAVDGIPVQTGGRPAVDGGTKPNPPGAANAQ